MTDPNGPWTKPIREGWENRRRTIADALRLVLVLVLATGCRSNEAAGLA